MQVNTTQEIVDVDKNNSNLYMPKININCVRNRI